MTYSKQVLRARTALRLLLLLAAAGTALPSSVVSQEPPDSLVADTVIKVAGLTVRAVRQATTPGGVTGIVSLPSSLPIPPVASVEDALRKMPFVLVRKNSRGMAEISVRGSQSRQVAVLLDGVPLTLAWDHRADPSVIPIMGAQNITMVRGLPSILGGPNVLGGVVEVNLSKGLNGGAEPDDISLLPDGLLNDLFRRDHHTEIHDLVIITGQHHRDNILDDIVHIPLDCCHY